MTILTIQQINWAIESNCNLVQLTTMNLEKVFFMLEEEYIEKNIKSEKRFQFYHNSFDTEAYRTYINRRWSHRLSEEQFRRRIGFDIEQFVAMTDYGAIISESQEEFDAVPRCIEHPVAQWRCDRFVPEHFPKGTLITVSRVIGLHSHDHLHPTVYTVDHVVQNGPNSFCVKTTTPESKFWKKEFADKDATYGFNISHVDKILMRGDGELKIVGRHNRDKQDVSFYDESHRCPQIARKNHWLSWNLRSIVNSLVGQPTQRGSYYDTSLIASELRMRPFVKEVPAQYMGLLLINKKRAKRFISQNKNRFLVSAISVQKEEDDYRYSNHIEDHDASESNDQEFKHEEKEGDYGYTEFDFA
jgi:hypothetical protein